jgi:transposase
MEDQKEKPQSEEVLSRYNLLMHAKESGNIAETCREYGLSRKSFYKWKKRYIENGLDGLVSKDALKERKSTFSKEEKTVVNISLESPSYGPSKIASTCLDHNIKISPSSVQKILNKNEIGTIRDRAKHLETASEEVDIHPSVSILSFLESYDKRYKDRDLILESGLTFAQGGKRIGRTQNGKEIGLQTIINLDTQFAFCHVFKGDSTFDALFVLRDIVIPFMKARGLTMSILLTKNSRVFTDKRLPYNQYIVSSGLNHHALSKRSAASVTQFFISVKNEFLTSCDINSMNIGDIQRNLQSWVDEYNKKPIQLFPNYGESPQNKWQNLIEENQKTTL